MHVENPSFRILAYLGPEVYSESCSYRKIQEYSGIFNNDSDTNINFLFFSLESCIDRYEIICKEKVLWEFSPILNILAWYGIYRKKVFISHNLRRVHMTYFFLELFDIFFWLNLVNICLLEFISRYIKETLYKYQLQRKPTVKEIQIDIQFDLSLILMLKNPIFSCRVKIPYQHIIFLRFIVVLSWTYF